jgi:cytidylate kinase
VVPGAQLRSRRDAHIDDTNAGTVLVATATGEDILGAKPGSAHARRWQEEEKDKDGKFYAHVEKKLLARAAPQMARKLGIL